MTGSPSNPGRFTPPKQSQPEAILVIYTEASEEHGPNRLYMRLELGTHMCLIDDVGVAERRVP